MASAGVDLGKVVSLLENEASLLADVGDELGELQSELESMRSFLLDAQRRSQRTEQTESQRTCVSQVRDTALEIEEIISEFNYHMNKQNASTKFKKCLYQASHLLNNLRVKHKIATKIKKIKKITSAISDRRQRYGDPLDQGLPTQVADTNWLRNHNELSLFLKDDDLVGFEDAKEKLHGWLLSGERQRMVISILGMGGSGKTTLIYVIKDLLRSLIKEFYLARKEVVPVSQILDDIWELELWNDIKIAMPNTQSGSRVMLTTQKEDIVLSSFGVESHVHRIQPLELDEARDLFHMKAFSNYPDRSCPTELKTLAWKLVEKCEGLPLAVAALGSLMSSKKTKPEWEIVLSGLNWQLNSNRSLQVVKRVLLFNFNDLPYQLKSCFLYCALFPESYPIMCKRLIRLWMAEGFVEQVKRVMPEQIADSYLMQLIFRSMLQVVKRNGFGRPKVSKMHDLMRELVLSISEREKFCNVYDEKEAIENLRARRLSIQTTNREVIAFPVISMTRSLLCFSLVFCLSHCQYHLPLGLNCQGY
ncbi:Disease resistance protein [Quillaja saponaria]|uniref:Disease resistance protein n=1 Tax=Quillaja saponaria TaxID=32244 RepID=A0AAD7PBV5_QUISA|nr:Disease resistance protein [Quillaja saponaria]